MALGRRRWNRCFTAGGYPKRRYETRAEAKAVMRRLAETDPHAELLEIYRCDLCGYFHCGHAQPKQRELV